MKSAMKQEEFRGFFVLVLFMLASGTLFYTHIEHWRVLDAFYFCVVTLVTVGYGDITPQTDLGKIFTIFYVILGVGIVFGLITILAHHAVNDIKKDKD